MPNPTPDGKEIRIGLDIQKDTNQFVLSARYVDSDNVQATITCWHEDSPEALKLADYIGQNYPDLMEMIVGKLEADARISETDGNGSSENSSSTAS